MAEKKAKLATDQHDIGSHLTSRKCKHCGEAIPADKLYPVRMVASTTKMVFYNKDHYKGA
jgi:hypothetical protein